YPGSAPSSRRLRAPWVSVRSPVRPAIGSALLRPLDTRSRSTLSIRIGGHGRAACGIGGLVDAVTAERNAQRRDGRTGADEDRLSARRDVLVRLGRGDSAYTAGAHHQLLQPLAR